MNTMKIIIDCLSCPISDGCNHREWESEDFINNCRTRMYLYIKLLEKDKKV